MGTATGRRVLRNRIAALLLGVLLLDGSVASTALATADGEMENLFADYANPVEGSRPISAVRVSPDGRYVAAAPDQRTGTDGDLPSDLAPIYDQVWDTRTGGSLYQGLIYAISPDWERFLDANGCVRELPSAKAICRLSYRAKLEGAGFSPDGSLLVTATYATDHYVLNGWNPRTGARSTRPMPITLNGSGGMTWLLGMEVISNAGMLRVVHAAEPTSEFHDLTGRSRDLLYTRLTATSTSRKLGLTHGGQVIELATGLQRGQVPALQSGYQARFSPDAEALIFWNQTTAQVWDVGAGRTISTYQALGPVVAAKLTSGESPQLLLATRGGVQTVTLKTGKSSSYWTYCDTVHLIDMDVSRDGRVIAEAFSNGLIEMRTAGDSRPRYLRVHRGSQQPIHRSCQEPGC